MDTVSVATSHTDEHIHTHTHTHTHAHTHSHRHNQASFVIQIKDANVEAVPSAHTELHPGDVEIKSCCLSLAGRMENPPPSLYMLSGLAYPALPLKLRETPPHAHHPTITTTAAASENHHTTPTATATAAAAAAEPVGKTEEERLCKSGKTERKSGREGA